MAVFATTIIVEKLQKVLDDVASEVDSTVTIPKVKLDHAGNRTQSAFPY